MKFQTRINKFRLFFFDEVLNSMYWKSKQNICNENKLCGISTSLVSFGLQEMNSDWYCFCRTRYDPLIVSALTSFNINVWGIFFIVYCLQFAMYSKDYSSQNLFTLVAFKGQHLKYIYTFTYISEYTLWNVE